MLKLVIITVIVFLLNIPFGYWRAMVKKFSWQWALAIHIPVPIIIALRIYSHIGFAWYTYLFLVSAFFLGQRCGAIYNSRRKEKGMVVSKCLLKDMLK